MSATSYSTRDGVAIVTFDNPPVNGLGHELRSGIVAGLDRANADPAVKALVLIGTGRGFSAGADVREFNTPKAQAEPTLPSVIAAVEASPKPVVAAVHGMAMGGGLELALGCHYRVASPDAAIALPEVKLGILPGAGGTQRLPRAVGLETALDMIVTGATRPSQSLAGLFDQIVAGDLLDGAVAFARGVAEVRPLPRVRDRRVENDDADGLLRAAAQKVAATARGYPAPAKCVEALAAAVERPFAEGLALERAAFLELVQSSESKALRHVFFAERAAAEVPGVPKGTPARPIHRAAVVGAGTMGSGISIAFASAGIPVTLLEVDRGRLDAGLRTIRAYFEGAVKKGKLEAGEAARRAELVQPTLSYADISEADIVIEAVFEEMEVKKEVFRELDRVMKPGAVLASNTSTLDLNAIAAVTARPADVVGTHFFSPAHIMRLLEVVRGEKTGADVLATVMALAKTLKKTAVVSGVCDGFIGNRMLAQYVRECTLLLEEGALPAQVDQALESWGMAMGPFRMLDLAGNDVGWSIRKRQYAERPDMHRMLIADRLCELGRFGQKTGAGWYRYEPGSRKAIPDPAVEEMILSCSKELGLERRQVTSDEIVVRSIFALVNEGARILDEGIAARASDIDVVYITGYGFPPYRGGPMHHADTVGLQEVVRIMERLARQARVGRDFWAPAPLLARLAAEGRSFT